jgi:hypothetical protein
MIGGSTDGNSRTPKDLNPMKPNNKITRFITIARTGLLILIVDKLAIEL